MEDVEQEQLNTLGLAEESGGDFTPKPLEQRTDIFSLFDLCAGGGSPDLVVSVPVG